MQDTTGNIAENKELRKKQETAETLDVYLSKDEQERVNEELVPDAGKVHLDPARRWVWNKEVEDAVEDDMEYGSAKDFGSVDGGSVGGHSVEMQA